MSDKKLFQDHFRRNNLDMFQDYEKNHNYNYRGVVEDIDDPEKAGRIRVRILGIHSDNKSYVKTEHLPWAIPATSIGIDGGGLRNIGNFKVPDIGSHVFVFFEYGDHNFPVYFAAAPAIEDFEDYQEKDGKFKDKEYEYDDSHQYDDASEYDEDKEEHETENDDEIEHPIQDWASQTRKNTFNEGGRFEDPPPEKEDDKEQPIFPKEFFVKDVRVAFDGKANHDAPGYHAIHKTKPSSMLEDTQEKQELDFWAERKWGFNDDDSDHQHNFNGGSDWKPEYPMCVTSRNAQGEIIDLDLLKERRTYIHPSKYFVELVQLDSSRKRDDFLNEVSIKRIYERQRGVGNSPSGESTPKIGSISGEIQTNNPTPLDNTDSNNIDRIENKITYDGLDDTREQKVVRFEERKHNPGREKTVIEDIVYRFFMNKVNETYQQDKNIRLYVGNYNVEIEHGDRNYRLHRGSHNQHIDEGNYSRVVNKGWEHLHVDGGHHFVEIGGQNEFEQSSTAEPAGNPEFADNQHVDLAQDGENQAGNQYFLIHKGDQWFRLLDGDQNFILHEGNQNYTLKDGNQTFDINGNLTRNVTGTRTTSYGGQCREQTRAGWEWTAPAGFIFNGDVLINGALTINSFLNVSGPSNFEGGHQGPNIDGH